MEQFIFKPKIKGTNLREEPEARKRNLQCIKPHQVGTSINKHSFVWLDRTKENNEKYEDKIQREIVLYDQKCLSHSCCQVKVLQTHYR